MPKLKSEMRQNTVEAEVMDADTLVSITVRRKGDEIIYKVDCAKNVKSEELAHYLHEKKEGICTWKPEVCEETVKSIIGTITTAYKKKQP